MRRILVTRPAAQAAALADALRAHGLEPVCVPTVEIGDEPDAAFERAIERLADFDWLIVTSANAVEPLVARLRTGVADAELPRVAAIGPVTAAALQRCGIQPDHVPARFLSTEIAAGLGELRGRRILLAQADAAREELRETLLARGAAVTETVAYRTLEAPPTSREPLRAALRDGLDLLTFASPSAARGALRLLEEAQQDRDELLRIPAACIGPVTAAEAARLGFILAVVAESHTSLDLAAAAAEHLKETVR